MLSLLLILGIAGCGDESERVAELATRDAERQARQNEQLLVLEQKVAQGAQELVAADAASRETMVRLQRDIQAERATIGVQRDRMEEERRVIASQRRTDPIFTSAFNTLTALVVILPPLIVCAALLRRVEEPVESPALTEILLDEVIKEDSLFPSSPSSPLLTTSEEVASKPVS